jgi:hypothetical protein
MSFENGIILVIAWYNIVHRRRRMYNLFNRKVPDHDKVKLATLLACWIFEPLLDLFVTVLDSVIVSVLSVNASHCLYHPFVTLTINLLTLTLTWHWKFTMLNMAVLKQKKQNVSFLCTVPRDVNILVIQDQWPYLFKVNWTKKQQQKKQQQQKRTTWD